MSVTQPRLGVGTVNRRSSRFCLIAMPCLESVVQRKRRCSRAQSRSLHQPRHPLAPGALTALAQLGMDPGAAIATATLAINRRHSQSQPLIFLGMLGGWPFTPGVVS